ncbi:HNH endonuclease family protein [Streptomyces sp. NPDC020800]|uniref:HNH endonuclease family protein n=1 Tax=Streptomyces sp. NPDC020800 TaxID=3365092 RepID=UPI0037B6389B
MNSSPRSTAAVLLLVAALTSCSTGPDSGASPADNAPAAATTNARSALAALPVKTRAQKNGYDRTAKFGTAWSDDTTAPGAKNSCDTRNDVLRRDLTAATFKDSSKCVVATGTLTDPYTATTIRFERGPRSSEVQIDHVVALSASWTSGAAQLPQAQREALANDPLNLLAVSGAANQQKSDSDASSWLPANTGFRCAYVARQIAVKAKYNLWVTPDERDAMTRVLSTCPAQPLPTDASSGVVLPT